MCVVPKAETIPDKPFELEEKEANGKGPPRDHAEKLFDAAKSNGKAKNGKVDTVVTAK